MATATTSPRPRKSVVVCEQLITQLTRDLSDTLQSTLKPVAALRSGCLAANNNPHTGNTNYTIFLIVRDSRSAQGHPAGGHPAQKTPFQEGNYWDTLDTLLSRCQLRYFAFGVPSWFFNSLIYRLGENRIQSAELATGSRH
ncbi:hypothetical protein BGW36DRAFT_76535 [Talaromyces proteolyticus]|uniref:Uncharacterized protein n=1 Tax=Talaromyces proteolyticus TaxID=1131652 RepID=A0AAD4KFG1_9EURO|nr:uncharacterized protein BGW36DRAFT_76535 [Talaromyces proteolyticus]KAH8689039.1 hypothetical protein BGW36DRAFT_76535 [Talaromyces proteolyticus]